MDFGRLAQAVAEAEAVVVDSGECAGLGLGFLYKNMPDEVLSGRAAPSRATSEARKVAKSYCKFIKHAEELMSLVEALPPGVRGPHPSTGMGVPSTPSRSKAKSSERALVVHVPRRSPGRASGAARAVFDHLPMAQTMCPDVAQVVPSPYPPNSAVSESQRAWHVQALNQFVHAGGNPAVWLQSMAQQRLFQQSSDSGQNTWRGRWLFYFGLLLTFVMPRVVMRLFGLIAELGFRFGISASARVGSAARDELNTAGERVVDFAEAVLGYCIDAQGFTPAPQQVGLPPAVAVIAASEAAAAAMQSIGVQQMSSSESNSQMAEVVQHSVAAAMTAVTQSMPASPSPPPPSNSFLGEWQMPSWVLVSFGAVMSGMVHRT